MTETFMSLQGGAKFVRRFRFPVGIKTLVGIPAGEAVGIKLIQIYESDYPITACSFRLHT